MKSKTAYCLSCTVKNELEKEIAMAQALELNIEGCEEKTSGAYILLLIYFPDKETAEKSREVFKRTFPKKDICVEAVVQEDWNAKWRENMQPARLTPNVWASPTWLPPAMKDGDLWIKIEPKMAFGTGHHESTQLPALAMTEFHKHIKNRNFIDIGAGSGILCFLAASLGARITAGVENDKDCLENMLENLENNPVKGDVSLILGTSEVIKQNGFFDLMTVNMIRTRSIPVIKKFRDLIKPSGLCIWSGLQKEEKPLAMEFISTSGWSLIKEFQRNDWWCAVIKKTE